MRSFIFLLLSLLWTISLSAQELSGIWRGYFIPNNDQDGRVYNYEIEISESPSHQLSIVTYTNSSGNSSTNFSAKALGNGFHSVNTNLVSIIETKFDGLSIASNLQACLMTNYLTYSNNRGRPSLEGTYISNNSKGTRDCGGGKIFLEKDMLAEKNKPADIAKNKKIIIENSIKITSKIANTNVNTSTSNATILAANTTKSKLKKDISNTPLTSKATSTAALPARQTADQPVTIKEDVKAGFVKELDLKEEKSKNDKTIVAEEEPEETSNQQQLPWVLVGRENVLIKKLNTSSKNLSIDLYDNGTIDNDTINIYDNKSLLYNKQRLSYKAIHLDLKFSPEIKEHEIIIVAHNMGSIPPNTALLVLKDGDTRQEFYITTTNKVNAKFIFTYKSPSPSYLP